MTKHSERLDSLAEYLRKQHDDLSVDSFLSFIYTSDIVSQYLEIEFRKAGLNRTKIMILHFLLAHGGTMTPTQLSNEIFRTKDTVTKALDSLDKLGLTKSSRTKIDRRLRKVTLTEKGLDLMEKLLPIRHRIFSQAMDCFSQEETEALKTTLKKFRKHILHLAEEP